MAVPDPNSMAQKSLGDTGETPEDVATLYSWANLHGAKYRDFSASRAEAREESRLRVEEAKAAEQRRLDEEAERRRQEEAQIAARLAAEAAEAARQAEAERLAEIARQAEAERQAVLAAQEAQRQAALQRSWQPPPPEAYQGNFSPSFTGEIPQSHSAASEPEMGHETQMPIQAQPYAADLAPSSASDRPFAAAPPHGADPASSFAPQWSQFSSDRFAADSYAAESYAPAPSAIQPPREPAASHAQPAPQLRPAASAPPVVPSHAAPSPYPEFANPGPAPGAAAVPASYVSAYASSYAPAASDAFSPNAWQISDLREAREQVSHPAWLAPELPPAAPAASSPARSQNSYPSPSSAPIHRHDPQPSAVPPPSQFAPSSPTQPPAYTQDSLPSSLPYQPQIPAFAPQRPFDSGQPHSQSQPAFPGQNSNQSGNSLPSTPPATNSAEPSGPVDDTLLGSRDRIANRWYALKSVFDPQSAQVEQLPAQPPARIPVLAVFSLAGGVGKTSLVASLGRALSARGERVLLVDTAAYGLLPFFFGARDQRPGMLRTFNPPGSSTEAPIQLVTLDPDGQAPESHDAQSQNRQQRQDFPNQDWLAQEVGRYARGANRILIDLPTASGATTRRVLRMNPVIIVPVAPDMNSVVSVGAIESFFRHNASATGGKPILPFYVLNQFDYSLPLHLDVREILRGQIGDRLLPFALRRSPAVSEALAEGMTVMDYAPNAVVAEDYTNLAGWVRSLSAPATQSHRGVRWSER